MSDDDPIAASPSQDARDSLRRDVRLVALIAVGVRLVWVLYSHRPPGGLNDPLLYLRFAQGIANGKGYVSFFGEPTAYYPPGYPYFLGGVQWFSNLVGLRDHMVLVAGICQSLLGGVAAGASVLSGRRFGAAWGDDAARRTGLAAGMVLAVWPNLVLYSGVLLSETLFVAGLAVFVAAVLAMSGPTVDGDRLRRGPALVAALSLGAATLVRPQMLVVVPALAVAWLVSRRGWRPVLRDLGVLAVGVVVVLTPWVVRNAVVLDAFVPLSNNGGDNLCVGFHPGASGHFEVPRYCDTGEFYIDGPEAELRREAETTARARRWATHHLGELPALSIRKLWYTYRSENDGLRAVESYEQDRFLPDAVRSVLRIVTGAGYVIVLLAAGLGAAAAIRRWWRERGRAAVVGAVLSMAVVSVLVPVAFFGDARFKVAATPLLALLAGLGIERVSRVWSARSGRPAQPSAPTGS